jgi:hypothetical protein
MKRREPHAEHYPPSLEAAEEIVAKLERLGWLEELNKMKRENRRALGAIEDVQLLEMVLDEERR